MASKFSTYYLPAILIFLVIALIISLAIIFDKFVFVPKILAVLVIVIIALLTKSLRAFVKDWYVFIAFTYLFDSFRGLIYMNICTSGYPVFVLYVYKIEKFIFGSIPSIKLQQLLISNYSQNDYGIFEKLITLIHGSHFLAFLFVGLAIYVYRKYLFKFYKISFYQLISIGLFGYFLVPTAPPWILANLFGLDNSLLRFNRIIYNLYIPDISTAFDLNPVAAMPSLHAAFPILCSLILWRGFKWKSIPFFIYTALLIFGIIYTGDHYFVDILAGSILAFSVFFLTPKIQSLLSKINQSLFKRISTFVHTKIRINQIELLLGSILLLFGIYLGLLNQKEFLSKPDLYSLYAPKYIDFFKNETRYENSFAVQFYLANYYKIHGNLNKALYYLKKSLHLAQDKKDIKLIMGMIEQIKKDMRSLK